MGSVGVGGREVSGGGGKDVLGFGGDSEVGLVLLLGVLTVLTPVVVLQVQVGLGRRRGGGQRVLPRLLHLLLVNSSLFVTLQV